jgi:hypothetical protein
MGTRERLWIFATALILLLLRQALGAGLSDIFADGVPGYGTAPGVTVDSRLHPDSDPPPIRVDGYLVKPTLEQSIGYDDNVLGGAHRQGSWLSNTTGSLLIASGWSRDSFGLFVTGASTRYFSLPNQDRTDGTVVLGGSVDIGRDKLTLGLAHRSQHEDRADLDATAADRPVGYRVDDVRVLYTAVFDRLTIMPGADLSAWHYGDTTELGRFASQSYRNRDVLSGSMTFRYEFAPLRNVVFVTRALNQHYREPLPGQASLNSTGYQVLGGLDYDGDTVWRARILVGAESRQFTAPQYRPRTAMIAEGELTWNPTGMTTLHANLTRGIEDAAQEGVSGFTYTEGKLRIDHELCRDVLLNASAGLRHAAYLQGGEQDGTMASAGMTWLVNRYARVSATYNLNATHGAGPLNSASTGFARDTALVTVRLGL